MSESIDKLMEQHDPRWPEWPEDYKDTVTAAINHAVQIAESRERGRAGEKINREIGRYVTLKNVVQEHFTVRSDFIDSFIDAKMGSK